MITAVLKHFCGYIVVKKKRLNTVPQDYNETALFVMLQVYIHVHEDMSAVHVLHKLNFNNRNVFNGSLYSIMYKVLQDWLQVIVSLMKT